MYPLLLAEKYKHYYVPQSLVKNWSKDGKHAQWFEPMTQRIIPNGGIGRYFHSNLVDISETTEETLSRINLYFENLIHSFLNGDTGWLKSDPFISAREILMFQLLQTPNAVFSPTSLFPAFSSSMELLFNSVIKKDAEEKRRTEEVKGALTQMMIYGIDLLDMEAVILAAPENRSFILGSSPVTLINPYFSSSKLEKYLGLQTFELWGSVIVLPLSPEKALCIYDRRPILP